jgi:hypothetical protein
LLQKSSGVDFLLWMWDILWLLVVVCSFHFCGRWLMWLQENRINITTALRAMTLLQRELFMVPQTVRAIFVWGRAKGEYEFYIKDSVLRLAAQLHHFTGAQIYIPGYDGRTCGQGETGYPDPGTWTFILGQFGVKSDCVSVISGEGHNTKTEFEDFMRNARLINKKRVIGVTTSMHVTRAMLGAVQSMDQAGPEFNMELIPVWPKPYDFSAKVWGSQGEGPFIREEWIPKEFARIPKYADQGDMATFARLDSYLEDIHAHLVHEYSLWGDDELGDILDELAR